MAGRIRISFAGQFAVAAGNVVVDGAALGPLGRLTLAFLVGERQRPVPRDELAEVLWGEDLPQSWEPSLRAVVSRVRRRLAAAGLAGDVIAGGGAVTRRTCRRPSLSTSRRRCSISKPHGTR